MSILENKSSVYSQNGEDGIISFIFSILNISQGSFIDVGAWDGIHLSNTFPLFTKGWEGIYIEADRDKFQKLNSNFRRFNYKVKLVNQIVGFTDNDGLDNIIENNGFKNKSFDFMSLDVDGLEYNILKSINKYLPKVICINVNPGHSPLFNRELPAEVAKNSVGQSMNVIFKDAQKKGYFPLCYTGNLFLVKNLYQNLFTPYLKSLKEIYIDYLDFLPTSELKYLYYYYIIKRDFSDKGITDDGAIFSNPELWHFCGDLAIKNRDRITNPNPSSINRNLSNQKIAYQPIYTLDENQHKTENNNTATIKPRVPYPTQTQIPQMNPHHNGSCNPSEKNRQISFENKEIQSQNNRQVSRPQTVYLRGNQHQPKKHPSYKLPFNTLSSSLNNSNNLNKEYVYKFGNPQVERKFNPERNVSFVDFNDDDKKETKIYELEKHIESLSREIKNLRYH